MWQIFGYEIATMTAEGSWQCTLDGAEFSSRNPEDVARGLLERWINSNHSQLPGGRVFVYGRKATAETAEPDDIVGASVRVRIWYGDKHEPDSKILAATAYLAYPISDSIRIRRRRRLLLPRPRGNEPTSRRARSDNPATVNVVEDPDADDEQRAWRTDGAVA